jgi:hypothetical protein
MGISTESNKHIASTCLQRTREQYRISGQLRIVTHEETDAALQAARREQWAGLSDNARIQVSIFFCVLGSRVVEG